MVCSVVVFCVAVMGCSSSDDGKTRELEGQLDMANQAEAQAQELIASLRMQIEELAQRADITPDAVAALQSQIAALSGRADISPADLAALQSQVAALSARADITPQDLQDLQAQLQELTDNLQTADQAGAEAQELIASLRMQIEELAQRADITPDAVAALQSQITALSGRADISPADLAALQSQVAALSARADITPQDLQDLQDQVQTLMGRADITPQALADLRDRVQELMGRPDITPQALQELRDEVAELSGRADITDQDLEDLREQLETLTSDLETAEQALIDRDVRLGMADTIHDLTGQNWGGNVKGAPWAAESATWYTGSPKHSAAFFSAVWFNDDQELEFFVDTGLLSSGDEQRTVIQTDPVEASLGRFIDTSRAGDGHPNVMTTTQEIEGHGLGVGWQGMQATKTYDGGGHLKIDLYTDAEASDNPVRANVRDEFQRDIAFEVIQPLPKDRDYQWFNLGSVALPGTLDGVPGHFTCADGPHPDCGFGTSPDNPERYDVATLNDVIFTPDDGSAPITLAAPGRRGGVPEADYLSLGAWQYVPKDVTDVAAYEVGMFVTAGDPFAAGGLTALSGTAQYAGKAVGLYANKRDVEDFSADVELTADFGSDADLGTLAGRVFNISLQSGAPSPLEEIGLSSEHWIDWIPGAQEHNIREDPPWNVGAAIAGGETVGWIEAEGWDGYWAGLFAGNGNTPTDHPSAFAGTFTATRDNEESFAGSFGAHKEP